MNHDLEPDLPHNPALRFAEEPDFKSVSPTAALANGTASPVATVAVEAPTGDFAARLEQLYLDFIARRMRGEK